MSLLRAEGIGVTVDSRWLLRDVTLDLRAGEIVALVGPNGAGKSTLLGVLAGDTPPTTGEVFLNGEPMRRLRPKELALRRAVLPQQAIIQFAFTAREVVTMGRAPLNAPDDDERVVTRAMEQTDAAVLASRVYPSLSVGEQSRVSLARVLAQETSILLLDEPTAALDLRHQQIVMRLARQLAAQGTAIAIIVHDLNLAAAFADRLVLLRRGEVVADGTPVDTLTDALLSDVFECDVCVTTHPLSGCPLVLPITPTEDERRQASPEMLSGRR